MKPRSLIDAALADQEARVLRATPREVSAGTTRRGKKGANWRGDQRTDENPANPLRSGESR